MSEWNDPFLRELFLSDTPLVDVRAPVEFKEGSLPQSLNFPIMNDEERRLVGTCYKEKGQEAAISLGHGLVSGEIKKERVQQWITQIEAHPRTEFFCFRGGLRSQIACQWLREAGFDSQPVPGGYKRMRRFFLTYLEQAPLPHVVRLGGLTGSGKTIVLNTIDGSIDLEKLASHRGSAFGKMGEQPSQIRFENELSLKLMRASAFTLVEDESAMIGRIVLPKRFHLHMRNSPLIILKCNEEERIQHIFTDYVLASDYENLSGPLQRIAKTLGGVRFKEISDLMKAAFDLEKTTENHAEWIKRLLHYYYDPLYQKDLKLQSAQVLFEGSAKDIQDFISAKLPNSL